MDNLRLELEAVFVNNDFETAINKALAKIDSEKDPIWVIGGLAELRAISARISFDSNIDTKLRKRIERELFEIQNYLMETDFYGFQ